MNNGKMKTLFMTVPSAAARRYLFFFPNCVGDQLQKITAARSDLRIVFLVLKKDYERYKTFLTRFPSSRVIIEPVSLSFKRTLFQKLMRFFYSYLLYTNTTRILATMGMRPGEPPAGGNRFAAPLKWLIANSFGRLRFVRLKVAPLLYYLAFRDRPLAPVFEKYHPDAVFLSSMYDRFETQVIPEAKRRGIRTIAMPASWDHVDKYYLPFHADVFVAHSEQIKRAAIRFQSYAPKSVIVTGYPHFDFLSGIESMLPREEVLASLHLPAGARYILYVSGSAYCPDEPDIVAEMLKWIDAGAFGENRYIVLRPYLGSRSKDKDFDAEKYARLALHPRLRVFDKRGVEKLDESVLYLNVMRHSAMVLAVYSTVFLESVIFDRPLVAAPFDGWNKRPLYRSIRRFEGFEHFKDVAAIGAIRAARSFPELKKVISDYFAHPERDAEKREKMRREICWKLDGRSSERLVNLILENL